MRGTRLGLACARFHSWIIPAHAGNTFGHVITDSLNRDHPRACGEHTMCLTDIDQELGSSPRMRGTLFWFRLTIIGTGIIPAHAGNTAWPTLDLISVRDHPRACGEHDQSAKLLISIEGSSPRMRGTHDLCRRPDSGEGIIPAHAGNTSSSCSYSP